MCNNLQKINEYQAVCPECKMVFGDWENGIIWCIEDFNEFHQCRKCDAMRQAIGNTSDCICDKTEFRFCRDGKELNWHLLSEQSPAGLGEWLYSKYTNTDFYWWIELR